MKEETVRSVMIEFFKSKTIEVIPQRGAGPDLHIKGKGVVEVKGTKTDFERLFRQIIDYAKKYNEVGLALAFDCLDNKRIERLYALEHVMNSYLESKLRLYLVFPTAKDDKTFLVRDCRDTGEVRVMMQPTAWGVDPQNLSQTLDKGVESLINYLPAKELDRRAALFGDHRVTEVKI